MSTTADAGVEDGPAALNIRHLSKSFGGAWALRDVALDVLPGEIHALVGENGSGKSTLIKILSGFHVPNPGADIRVDGVPLPEGNPGASHRLGCRFVHQDLGLVDSLSVADNVTLGSSYPTRLGTIRSRRWGGETRAALELVGLEVDPAGPVGQLTPAAKTGVALARALRPDSQGKVMVLVLDEPTASLPSPQVAQLHEMVRAVVATGVGVIYVSHHLHEVFELADRVTVLRDGAKVATRRPADLDHRTLVDLIVGGQSPLNEEVTATRPHTRTVLSVRGLRQGSLRGLDLEARAGEILGIAGLTGSGRDAVLPALFGVVPREAGTVSVNGAEVAADPRRAMRQGVAFLPPDRKTLGGVMSHSARENFAVTDLQEFWRFPFLRGRAERTEAERWFERLDVRPRHAAERKLETLSGGNQQKVLLAKWLRRAPALLLLEEPTQGVDIAAKALLHAHIRAASREGASVLVSSADNEELATLCDSVIVLRRGVVCARLQGAGLTAAALTHASLGEVEERAS